MSALDWTALGGNLLPAEVARGVTNGVARPQSNLQNRFVFGFNSQVGTPAGVAGFLVNQSNFNPTALGKGGSIRGCIQRGVSAGNTGFAPFLYIGLQGSTTSDLGYMLGLGDGDPSHLVLRKGSLLSGLPDVAPPTSGVLRRSTPSYALGVWLHVRLDMIVNGNGDVVLNVYANDLATNPIGSPESWLPITGMAQFVDDALGVNTGSLPYTNGRLGYGFWVNAAQATRRGFIDHVACLRQL